MVPTKAFAENHATTLVVQIQNKGNVGDVRCTNRESETRFMGTEKFCTSAMELKSLGKYTIYTLN